MKTMRVMVTMRKVIVIVTRDSEPTSRRKSKAAAKFSSSHHKPNTSTAHVPSSSQSSSRHDHNRRGNSNVQNKNTPWESRTSASSLHGKSGDGRSASFRPSSGESSNLSGPK
jgi:hypothetical protein